MMQATKEFRYAESPEAQVLELPMPAIVLSYALCCCTGMPAIWRARRVAVHRQKLYAWIRSLRSREVQLWLPKQDEFGVSLNR